MGIKSFFGNRNIKTQKSITSIDQHIKDSLQRVDRSLWNSETFVKRIHRPVKGLISFESFYNRYKTIASKMSEVKTKDDKKLQARETKKEKEQKKVVQKKSTPEKVETKKKEVKNIENVKTKTKVQPKKNKGKLEEPEKTLDEINSEKKQEELLNLKVDLDKKTRQNIMKFIMDHFYRSDIKTRSDFENKFKNVLMERFEKKGLSVDDAKKMYNFTFKWFKADTKIVPLKLTESDLAEFDKTVVLRDSTKKSAIKESMQFTLDNIRSIQSKKLLSREKEQMYAKMCNSSNPEERERGRINLVNSNLRLIISQAKKYNHKGVKLSDLCDEGYIGLNRAIEKFDWEKGNKFSTYATWWIRQSITRAISDQGKAVRIPVHIIEQMQKSSKTERNIALREGTEPTQEALKKELKETHKINLTKLNTLKKTSSDPISFDKSVGDFENSRFSDFLADETLQRPNEYVAEALQAERIKKAIEKLNENEKQVIKRYFGFPPHVEPTKNLSEIARTMDMKPEAIKTIYADGLNKMKRYIRELERRNSIR